MSIYDLQGLAPAETDSTILASNVSWWSCGDNRPSDLSFFACG
ncbi:SapB/AmfS family lanthipeptide [Streptomyces sp. NPDC018964]